MTGMKSCQEGIHYNFTPGGHTLVAALPNPATEVIKSVREGEVSFGLAAREQALFLLIKIGTLPWRAAHYNWWINPPVMRPDALGAFISNDTVIDINMCLVDAETGIVKALKTLRLSEDFSEALLQIVELQARNRFDPWAYLDTVEKAAIDYQNERVVVAESIVMCSPRAATDCWRPLKASRCIH
ncbi:MAG: hypothetical protein ACP5LD_15740 [Desulfomonilaceae bacterium]